VGLHLGGLRLCWPRRFGFLPFVFWPRLGFPLTFGVARLHRPVALAPPGRHAPALQGGGGRSQVDRGLPVVALGLQAPVIDSGLNPRLAQPRVLQAGEPFPPAPDFAALEVVQFAGFLGEPRRRQPAGGQQDVGVVVALVAVPARPVDRHVGGAAVPRDQLAGEIRRQPSPLFGVQFGGQGDLELAGHRGVFAGFRLFGGVPQPCPVARPVGGGVGDDQ
jgi:hypothetical protein